MVKSQLYTLKDEKPVERLEETNCKLKTGMFQLVFRVTREVEPSPGVSTFCDSVRHGAVRLFAGAASRRRASMKSELPSSKVDIELVHKNRLVLGPQTAPRLTADADEEDVVEKSRSGRGVW